MSSRDGVTRIPRSLHFRPHVDRQHGHQKIIGALHKGDSAAAETIQNEGAQKTDQQKIPRNPVQASDGSQPTCARQGPASQVEK